MPPCEVSHGILYMACLTEASVGLLHSVIWVVPDTPWIALKNFDPRLKVEDLSLPSRLCVLRNLRLQLQWKSGVSVCLVATNHRRHAWQVRLAESLLHKYFLRMP